MTRQRNDGKGQRKQSWFRQSAPSVDRKRHMILMVIMVITAVVMVIAAILAVLYSRWVKKPQLPELSAPVVESQDIPDESGPDTELTTIQPKVGGVRKSKDIYTILVFGEDETSSNTDTIMLVTYDVTNQRATVMYIPRDTLVNVKSGTVYTRINSIYSLFGCGQAGIQALSQEVAKIVGFYPDFYVKVDWELVGQMVDTIGGVWYEIPYYMDYDDPVQSLFIHYDKGLQHLSGEDAMNIVRWRKNNKWSAYKNEGDGSDLGRLHVQQGLLKAVLDQTLRIQNIPKIRQLSALFSENITSNLTVENLLWFASQAIFGGLNADDVEFLTMPYQGFLNLYVYPDQESLLTLINDKLNPYKEEVTIEQLDLIWGNPDGTLSASSGVLADPRAAQ